MDINDKIAENVGLVYQQLHRFKLTNDQDAESYAYEALYKAVLTYDERSGNAFSTYAVCVIANALRGHIRHINRKRQLETVSLFEPMSNTEDSPYLLDVLGHPVDTESAVMANELREVFQAAYQSVCKDLPANHRKIIEIYCTLAGKASQQEVAKIAGVSQVTVSRAVGSFKNKMRIKMEDYL